MQENGFLYVITQRASALISWSTRPDTLERPVETESYSFEAAWEVTFLDGVLPGPPKPPPNGKPCGCGAISGAPKKEASASLSLSLNTMNFGVFSVQGFQLPPFGPLGSLYLAKFVQAVSIFSLRSQSPLVHGRQQCFKDLKTNQRSDEWKAPFRRWVTSGWLPSSGNGRANS